MLRQQNRNKRGAKKGQDKQVITAEEQHDQKLVRILSDIRDIQNTQIRGVLPVDPDVPEMKLKRNKVYTFTRAYVPGSVSAASTDQSAALYFTITMLPDFTEFTALFDQYRFAQVTVEFLPNSTIATSANMYTVIDYDDATPLGSFGPVLEYSTLAVTCAGAVHKRTLVPRVALAAFQSGFNGYVNASNQWIDANSSPQHYGLKWFLPAYTAATSGILYTINVKVILQCRNTH